MNRKTGMGNNRKFSKKMFVFPFGFSGNSGTDSSCEL